MAKFRTPKNARTSYIYRDAYGRKTEITPDMESLDGQTVTADLIVLLHDDDDADHNAAKRDAYHGLTHYEQESQDEGKTLGDKQTELEDYSYDPETVFFGDLDANDRSAAIKAEWDKLTDKQRRIVAKKMQGLTNVQIGKEENTTEAAVRGCLERVQKRFEKFLK